MSGEVSMTVPARPEYVRAVRLVAASLAADNGFDMDQLEDIRVAVDELCALLQPSEGDSDGGRIAVELAVSDTDLEVRGRYEGSGRTTAVDWLVREIVTATSDEVEWPTETDPAFRYVRRRAR